MFWSKSSRWSLIVGFVCGALITLLFVFSIFAYFFRLEARLVEQSEPIEDGFTISERLRGEEVADDKPQPAGRLSDIVKVALNRKLIREAWLTLHVQEVPKVVQKVRQVTKQLNGYIASISQSREPTGEWRATITVRVPSERYHDALYRLQGLGRIEDLREEVQDVTEEFMDLEVRLRNLKRSETQLLELLKKTGRVRDLLDVERELSQRRTEIERLEGRLRFLTHQTIFSIIHVTLQEFRPRPMPGTAFSVPKIFADAFRTIVTILRGLVVIAIWVLVFGIFWVPALLIGRWLVRRRRLMEQM